MNTNRMLLAGIAGGVVFFLLGFLFYGVLLAKFFAANQGTAQGVMKEPPTWWALILGNLAYGFLLAVIYERWASISTFATGARAGAIIGALVAFSVDFNMLGTTNISTLNGALVDVVVFTVMSAVVGGVVGLVLGRGGKV
jgi:hypothetical protein